MNASETTATSGRDGTAGHALQRARAAALAELRARPVARPWRREALHFALLLGIITAVTAAVSAAIPLYRADRFAEKALPVLLLVATQVAGAWGAVAPRGRRFAWATLGLGLVALAVATRGHAGETSPSELPGWVCSTSHLAIGLVPLVTALTVVRRGAFRWDRALAAGVGAGAMGMLMGELCCERGALHVLVHHGGAWFAIALAVALIARVLRPRSFAP